VPIIRSDPGRGRGCRRTDGGKIGFQAASGQGDCHEAARSSEDEQGIEQARGDHLVDLGVGELKLLQQIDEEHTDAAIDV